MHGNHSGPRTERDWDVRKVVSDHDWPRATNNAIELRGRYRTIGLHPGAVLLVPAVRRLEQMSSSGR
jgi:hypothetical protein